MTQTSRVRTACRPAGRAAAWVLTSALVASATLPLLPSRAAVAQSAPVPDVATVIANMQQAYEGIRDFRADFTQEYTNQSLGDTDTSSGVVHFMRPGRMRWDYVQPTLRLFISDGSDLWIYEPTEAQYYTQSLADSDLPTALRFLMGDGDLARDFDVTLDASSTADRVVLILVPKESEGQYTRLRFVVDATTWFVTETTIYDPVGNTNRLRFQDRAFNVGYEAEDFTFSPPAGTTRIATPQSP